VVPDRRAGNPTMVLIALVVASFVLMTFDIRSQGEGLTSTFRTGAQALAAPLQDATRVVVDPIVDLLDGIANLTSLRAENGRLRSELETLRAEAAEAGQLRAESELLRTFLNLPGREIPSIVAEIRSGGGPLDTGFTINRGLDAGVVVGNPVVDENDVLLGVVREVFPTSAIVVPVIGPTSGVEVVTGAGDLGVLQGLGSTERLGLLVLGPEFPLFAGDILRTSGRNQGIPGGLQVARVLSDVAPSNGQIDTTEVAPLTDPTFARFVVVLQYSAAPDAVPDEPTDEVPTDGTAPGTSTP